MDESLEAWLGYANTTLTTHLGKTVYHQPKGEIYQNFIYIPDIILDYYCLHLYLSSGTDEHRAARTILTDLNFTNPVRPLHTPYKQYYHNIFLIYCYYLLTDLSRHPSDQLRVISTHLSGSRNLERPRWANWNILFSKDSSSRTESVILLWVDPSHPYSEKAWERISRSTAPTVRIKQQNLRFIHSYWYPRFVVFWIALSFMAVL